MIPHVDTFFQDKLKVPVEYFNPFEKVAVSPEIDGDRVNADLHCMGEVVGLALRRVLTCPIEINLMPPDLVARKVFRRRKPFFALSVAGVVLTMVCWWVYFFRMGSMYEARVEQVKREVSGFVQKQKNLVLVTDERYVAEKRLDEVLLLIADRSQWIELLGAIRGCMEAGMWMTSVTPEISAGRISRVEIMVQAFTDRLQDTDQGTATERFRNRLRATPFFKENSEIVSEMAVGAYLRRFSIRLELINPINTQ